MYHMTFSQSHFHIIVTLLALSNLNFIESHPGTTLKRLMHHNIYHVTLSQSHFHILVT